jgi:hypothetical protein
MTGIIIVGMHRSGTSLVSSMAQELGVYLGETDELLPPHPEDNPKGYFERRDVMEINDEIIRLMGGDPPYEAFLHQKGWHRLPMLDKLRDRASQIVQNLHDRAGEGGLWGIKDPRFSFTLDFWADIALSLGDVKVIWCWRHPAEVVQSLARRGLGPDEALYRVIGDHHDRIMRSVRAYPFHIVSYERVITEPRWEAIQLAGFLRGAYGAMADPLGVSRAAKLPDALQKRSYATRTGTLRTILRNPAPLGEDMLWDEV